MLHQFAQDFVKRPDEKVLRQLCILVDPFASEFSSAPSAISRRLNSINAACEEVVLRWQAI